jgi:ABC-2 type transport system ATP-binding protein
MAAIEVVGLRRTYLARSRAFRHRAPAVEALRGISFSVEPGELYGLLGPNGAGKTTTIKILTTLLIPTAGSVRVLGLDPVRQASELRGRIGYVFGGDRGLYERLSALDNLRYFADLYRVPRARRSARIDQLLEQVGLVGRERERVETYSRGMRQRLHIARGLLHDPPVLLLDEPTIGLDPVGARELRVMVKGLRAAGKTILLTTHYMFEADDLCDRLAVIADGLIVGEGSPAELKRMVTDQSIVEIQTFGVDERTLDRLRHVSGVNSVVMQTMDQEQLILVQSAQGSELVQPLLNELRDAHVGRVTAREPTLEDAYVQLVGEA